MNSKLYIEQSERIDLENQLEELKRRLQDWIPDNASEAHLKKLLNGLETRTIAIRSSLSGIRLKDVSPEHLHFITDTLESLEAQIRAGCAAVRLQLGLDNVDDVANLEAGAEACITIDSPLPDEEPEAKEKPPEPEVEKLSTKRKNIFYDLSTRKLNDN